MSGSIEKLTAAIEANTAVQEKVLAALKGGAKASTASAKEEPKAKAEPKAKTKPSSKKKTTVEDIAKAFGEYLGIKDKDEREERKGHVKAIVEYFNVAKATEIDPENFDEALEYLQQYIDGQTPEFDGGDEDDESDGDEALV